MKRKLLTIALALVSLVASADKCEISMGIAPIQEGENVPDAVARQLEARLKNALSRIGVAAGDFDCQFFITGRFDHEFTQEASGVGGRVLVKTNLQLAICDGENRKVYASESFPLKGVGATDQQALTRCLSSLGAGNQKFVQFVENAKVKIVDYFNSNYNTYLAKAQSALKARNYDESLYWATRIPECCTGFDEAMQFINSVWTDKTNYDSQQLLAKAQGAWAANPTMAGAQEAFTYLSQIDPSATCYPAAQALSKTIGATVKSDYDFENRTKYQMEKDLERRRIDAARDVGVAWAQNQPKTIYRNNWIVW